MLAYHIILHTTSWLSHNSTQFWHFTWSWHGILQVKGSVPQDFSHLLVLQMFDASSRSPGYPELLFNLDTNLRFPWSSLSLGSISLLEWFTELRETHLLKDMLKGTDDQPEDEIQRVRSRRVQSAGTSVPVELECVSLSVHSSQTYLEAHQALYYWCFMEASSHRHDQLLKAFLDSLLSLDSGAENSQLLHMAWSFWQPAPIQSHLFRTKNVSIAFIT